MTRAVVYARISRDRAGAGLGVERQREDCQRLADQLGWSIVEVFTDNDISAYSGKARPAYTAMLAVLDAGGADAVLAWHTDRLHRSPRELETFIDLCDRRSIDVRTVQAGSVDLSTASGKMVARMLGAAARHEVEHSVERQRRAKLAAALDGKFRGGRRPFGFEPDGVTVRPAEAAAVTMGTSAALAGESLNSIARSWNEAGLTTSMGGQPFTSRTVRNVLLRARNAALVTREGQVVGPARWPALVPEGDYWAVSAMLRDPARRPTPAMEKRHQGTGVYRCGICGEHMITHTGASSRGRGRGYRCSATAHLYRIAGPLDEYVSRVVLTRLARPDAALVLGGAGVDVAALQRSRDGLQGRLDELATMFAEGEIDGPQLRAGSGSLREKIERADNEIARARSSSVLADLVLSGDDLAQLWGDVGAGIRGRVVDTLMTVTVLPAPRGRQPGGGYFNPEFVDVEWKVSS